MNRIARIVLQPGNFIVEGIQGTIGNEIPELFQEQSVLNNRLRSKYLNATEGEAYEARLALEQNAKDVAAEIEAKQNAISGWDKMRTPLNLAAYGLYATPVAWGISNSYNDMVNEELRQRQRAMMAQQGVYPR